MLLFLWSIVFFLYGLKLWLRSVAREHRNMIPKNTIPIQPNPPPEKVILVRNFFTGKLEIHSLEDVAYNMKPKNVRVN